MIAEKRCHANSGLKSFRQTWFHTDKFTINKWHDVKKTELFHLKHQSSQDLVKQYNDVFKGFGCIKEEYSIEVDKAITSIPTTEKS